MALNVDVITLGTPKPPTIHGLTHQNNGADEINVAGLLGLLADPQNPLGHALSHQNNGLDELNVAGLSGLLADPQTPLAHSHGYLGNTSDNTSIAAAGGALNPQLFGSGGAAGLSFHRPNVFACNFGIDTDSKLKVGGWSMGNNAYCLYHEGIMLTKTCKAYASYSQSISSGTLVPLSPDSEQYDSDNMWDYWGGNTKMWAQRNGYYMVCASIELGTGGTNNFVYGLCIRIDGTGVYGGNMIVPTGGYNGTVWCTIAAPIYLPAGHFVEVCAWQTSGGARSLTAATPNNPERNSISMAYLP